MINTLSDALARVDRSILVLLGIFLGLVIALLVDLIRGRIQRRHGRGILTEARSEAARVKSEAAREADAARNAGVVAGKMEALKLREELDREIQRRREEWERAERRVEDRSRALERKLEDVAGQERQFRVQEQALAQRELDLRAREGEIDKLVQEQRSRLERVAGLTAEDARREILQRVEDEARTQAGAIGRASCRERV